MSSKFALVKRHVGKVRSSFYFQIRTINKQFGLIVHFHFFTCHNFDDGKVQSEEGKQCDQICRNFATLARSGKTWTIFKGFGQNFELTSPYFIFRWANFNYCEWPNIEEIIKPSGHTEGKRGVGDDAAAALLLDCDLPRYLTLRPTKVPTFETYLGTYL